MTVLVANSATMSTLPPPTINSLDASQRARLIKSARKLGSMLGATPHVLDPDLLLPVPPRGKCNGQLDLYRPSSAASSASSFEDKSEYAETSVLVPTHPQLSQNRVAKWHRRPKSAYLARPLVLRLRTVPSLPAMDARVGEPPSSAFISTITNEAEIPTPLPHPISIPSPLSAAEEDTISPIELTQDAIRRKRMAKLTRTLGENIPPEFISPKNQPQYQRFTSEPPSSRSTWPRRHEVELPIATASHTPASAPSTVRLSHSHYTVNRNHYRKSASLGTPSSYAISSHKLLLAERPTTSPECLPSLTPVRRGDVTGNESPLDGEWSIKDAEKRAMALRNLRSR